MHIIIRKPLQHDYLLNRNLSGGALSEYVMDVCSSSSFFYLLQSVKCELWTLPHNSIRRCAGGEKW